MGTVAGAIVGKTVVAIGTVGKATDTVGKATELEIGADADELTDPVRIL
jgi:hypothetical protein